MSFQPFLLGSGLSGWNLLKSTLSMQKTLFNENVSIVSDSKYFLETFAKINTPEDIISDPRVMRVVLGAYGLSGDIGNKFFIKKVIQEGVNDPEALSNKLSDRRYHQIAKDFNFSGDVPNHKLEANLAKKVVENFQNQSFEIEIGNSDTDMRLALGFSHEMEALIDTIGSNNSGWFQILATPPLREIFQTSLGLPTEFSQLDIDEQHERIQEKAMRVFGTSQIEELGGDQLSEQITNRFLIMRQAKAISSDSSLQTALVLLSAIPKLQ